MTKQNNNTIYTIKRGNKIIAIFKYDKNDNSINPYLHLFLKEYERLHNFFGVKPRVIEIRFIYTRAEMSKHWGKTAPRWLSGMVDNKNQYLIYIFSPTVIEKLTEERKKIIKPTIIHETAHTFVSELNKRCYYWINEGICQILEGKRKTDRIKKKNWRWFVNHSALTDPNLEWIDVANRQGYAISYLITKYLLKKCGRQAVIDLIKIRRVKDTKINLKMEKIIGQPIDEFLNSFEKTLRRKITA